MKLETVLQLNNTLKTIIDKNDLKIDPLFKFRLLGVMKNIEVPVLNFETIRNEKIREYGKKNTDGNIEIPNDDKEMREKFLKDLNDIINSDVEVNIQKLKPIDVFNKGLPAEYLVSLYPIIEE